ncbi:MAG TPA: sulfatase-like hydrolase/transferase [Vicinamibacterales bacterium]|nr:sulfatase-like hydrolase/transferase [Vicinamibacterales bacterium]
MAGLALAIAAACPPFVPAEAPAGTNILLITVDTLRADRLGSYGYKAAKTPVLDALAGAGIRFADATAHAPLTHPSHSAILTGRYPGAFGIRLNGMDPLPADAVTLAERLTAAGYRTGAVVASVVLDKSYGLAQGFDHYDDAIAGPVRSTMAMADLQRDAAEVTAAAKAWIAQQRAPWFLWVHYYDPHLPYAAPARHTAAAPGRPYDAEIAFVDAEIGALLGSFDRSSTTVVMTSDHGEALGEHGEPDHGFFLYDATLRVPLIIAGPGITPRVVREQVRSIDIAPTIAQIAGAGWEPHEAAGESLHRLIEGGTRSEVPVSIAESWYPRLHFGWSELRSARVGEWKYIAAPSPELYDLRSDNEETRNVVADRAQVAGRLAGDMRRITSRFSEGAARPPAPQPDAATIERLQALGYVGAFAPVTATAGTENPKDHIADYRQYRELFNRALGLLGRERPVEAIAILRRLVKSNVRAFEAHLYLGNAHAMQGSHEAALGEYDVAAQLNPSLATPHFEAAKVLIARGNVADAVARARRGLAIEPQSFYGNYTLGVVHQRAAQWTEAFTAFGRAVELNGRDPRARANLAGAAMRVGSLEVARAQFEAMIDLKHQVAPAHFNLGVIAARRGNRAEAERRYKLALQVDPAFKPARDALAKLK